MVKWNLPGIRVSVALLLKMQVPATMMAQQPNPNQQTIQQYYKAPSSEPQIPRQQLIELLREKVKYVFVFYQENRYIRFVLLNISGGGRTVSSSAANTPGFVQPITNVDGSPGTTSPFRIGPQQFAADTDDVDHSHALMVAKMNVQAMHRR